MKLMKHAARVAAFGLRRTGYRFEPRRSGETRLGLWRKSFRSVSASAEPRRFVLIPGLGDSPLSWLGVLALLSPVLRMRFDEIVLVDFPGFRGTLHEDPCFSSMDELRGALHDALDSLRPRTVFGHSLGGWLTASYAVECGKGARPKFGARHYAGPERIVLTAPSGVTRTEESRAEWRGRFEGMIASTGFPERQIAFEKFRRDLFLREPRWFRWVAPAIRDFFFREDTAQLLNSVREEHFVESELGAIRSEVWLLWGEHDRLSPTSWIGGWMRGVENGRARAIFISKAGHGPHLETPLAMAGALGQILLGREPHERIGRLARLWHRA